MPDEQIIIREAIVNDGPFLRRMMWEAISASPALIKHLGVQAIEEREASYWAGWLTQPDPAFVAVDANGRSVGGIVLQPHNSEKPGWRIGIGVEAEMRGRRIGRSLIERALTFARAGGVTIVSLSVDPSNTVALALYERIGFVSVGVNNDMIEMHIDLTPNLPASRPG